MPNEISPLKPTPQPIESGFAKAPEPKKELTTKEIMEEGAHYYTNCTVPGLFMSPAEKAVLKFVIEAATTGDLSKATKKAGEGLSGGLVSNLLTIGAPFLKVPLKLQQCVDRTPVIVPKAK